MDLPVNKYHVQENSLGFSFLFTHLLKYFPGDWSASGIGMRFCYALELLKSTIYMPSWSETYSYSSWGDWEAEVCWWLSNRKFLDLSNASQEAYLWHHYSLTYPKESVWTIILSHSYCLFRCLVSYVKISRKLSSLKVYFIRDSETRARSLDDLQTLGYCTFVGDNLITWKTKWAIVAWSSAKAEYWAMTGIACELMCLTIFSVELSFK